ncbi:DUF72 domain-containing protein [Hydrocarboniphaga sp.]|uniref:DUF72 domain-containing protein n=1 Tax=Hydrocarboniphaga sp. TaxID=2033016 RepID=UPI003D139B8E
MQTPLFDDKPAPSSSPRRKAKVVVGAAAPDEAHAALAEALPSTLWLGTSSWNYPGWKGSVWDDRDYELAPLSKHGLRAYSEHPLLGTVSLDRAFYKALTQAQYAAYAAQVPDHFRFVVKAPALVADALIREEGRALAENGSFLDPALAFSHFVEPAIAGLGQKLGALVFQISPLPSYWLARPVEFLERLALMLRALPMPEMPALLGVELRDPLLVSPEYSRLLIELLRDTRTTYCLSLHGKMPPIEAQLPILRALWPGPMVCRWNLHRRHGAYGYEAAKKLYGAFDQLVDPDIETRQTLAKVAAATAGAGHAAYITIGNKAEGSAPRSVFALAQEIAARLK